MVRHRQLYVETTVAAPVDQVWACTQDVREHARWDLRFGGIETLDGAPGEQQRFRYATFGISGEGVSVGERRGPDGSATSALRFSSDHPLSVIAHGSGYWRYEPVAGGTRFLTGYDYRARYPRLDRLFRPLMGWATAWSFDRLRLWLERGVSPEQLLVRAVLDVLWRVALVIGTGWLTPLLGAVTLLGVLVVPVPPGVPSGRRPLRRPPERARRTRDVVATS